MTELLAFDVGVDIIGIIDLHTCGYNCYPGPRMVDGVRRILDCEGVVITFNGTRYDMPELAKIAGISDADALPLKGAHCDMCVHASRDRWPPRDEEDGPILGTNLWNHYQHYYQQHFGWPPSGLPVPPAPLDPHERSNWQDCYMAGELWRWIIDRHPEKP